MALDGVIILDNAGRPIIQSGFRSQPTAYPLLHIDALNDAFAQAKREQDVDPVLYVASHSSGGPSACCHVQTGGMRFLCPVSGDMDPLYAFAFLQTFIDILTEYFGTVSTPTLRDNFDIIYQLLEETLDSIGHPLTTSPNALRDIVLPPTLLSKVLSVAGASNLASNASGNPFASAIPWRKANVRHANNEVYFDVVENLRAVVNKSGTALTSTVLGKIDCNAKLSGTPDLLLSLANVQHLVDASFHACVRLQRWTRDKSLSFVPPDGRFALMEYRFSPPAALSVAPVPVPVILKPHISLNESGGTVELSLSARGKALERVSAEIVLGTGVTGASCTTSGGSSWSFDVARTVLSWDISALGNAPITLRGTFTSTRYPRPARAVRISFEAGQHSFSGVKVETLRVSGEAYKPYKGFRARSQGQVEWRW